MDRDAIEALVAKFPVDKQDFEREQRLRALEEWNVKCAAANKACRVDELRAAHEAAREARLALWDQLAESPAQSTIGIAVKLAALMHYEDEYRHAWTGRSPIEFRARCSWLHERTRCVLLVCRTHSALMSQGEFVEEEEGA
jgi:hypothetical protein